MIELSRDQIAAFQDHGFVVVDKLIDGDAVLAARGAFDRLFRGEFERGVLPDEVNWQEDTGRTDMTRQICNGWKADRTIAAIVLREDIGRAIAQLAGWPGSRIMQDNVIWKPPGARPLGYHQDDAYISWVSPARMASCWIALDDTTAAGGTMEVVPGSHRWAVEEPSGLFHGPEDYQRAMREAAARAGIIPRVEHVVVPAGGGLFHHGGTWHGSGMNNGDRPRRALVVHALSSEARFRRENIARGNGPIYGRYLRLGDDTMDESYFPVLWTEDGRRTMGIDGIMSETLAQSA